MENRLSLFCDRVIEAGWLAAAVTVPLFFNVFSSRVFEPDKLTLLRSIVLVMAAAWLIRVLIGPRTQGFSFSRLLRASPLALPVCLFAAVYIVATAASVAPRTSFWGSYVRLQGLVTNLSYLTLFFLVAYNLRTREQLNRLITVVLVTSIPISLYGIIQHYKLDPLPWGGDVTFRVTSTMGNAIFLAAYLIMVVPLTLVRLVQAVSGASKSPPANQVRDWLLVAAYGAALGLQLATIVLTKSRGPWIGLGLGLAVLGLLWLMRTGRRRLAAGVLAVFAVLLALTLAINIPNSPLEPVKKANAYLERVGTIMDMQAGTNRVRTLIWFGDSVGKGAAGLIMAEPRRTLLGYGPESMYVAYNPFYPPELANLEARNATPDRSHNDLLDYLVITGFLGLFTYFLVIVRAFSLGLQQLWKAPSLAQQGLVVGILGAITAHIVESLVGIAIASSLTYTWLLLGCLASAAMLPGQATAPAVAPAQSATAENTRARRRRVRKAQTKRETPVIAARPWSKNAGFYLLVAYCAITAIGTAMTLSGLTARDPDPVAFVAGGYGWLLVGIFIASLWVRRTQEPRGRVTGQALLVAGAIGVVAILLPIKLFLGGVIADIHFKKGQSLAAAQRFDQAVGPYLEALQWDPDQDYYLLFLGQAYLELARASREDKAPRRIDGMNDLLSFRDRSVAQLGRENLFQAAVVTLKRAQELSPLNTDHSANLGRLYRLWGELSTDPSVRRDRWTQSVEFYRGATTLSPNAAHLKAEWGLIYYFLGDFQEAQKQYREAQRLDRLYSPSYAYLGDLHRAMGNEDAAVQSFREALAINDSSHTLPPPQEVAVRSTLGQIYFQRGLLQQSAEENLKLLQISPRDPSAHKNLAIIYRQMGDRGKALEEARLALNLAPAEERSTLQAFINEMQGASP